MKKTLYYTAHPLRRINYLKTSILFLALIVCSWPRVFLEVFLRKNMGPRYFTLFIPVAIFLLYVMVPLIRINDFGQFYFNADFWEAIRMNPGDSVFLFLFLGMSVRRYFEIKNGPSVFDFEKYSLSRGEVHPFFYLIKINGKQPTIRMIETILEPAACLLIGIIIELAGIGIGGYVIYCSIIYSLSSFGMYHLGDEFVMDKIDEIICNEELTDAFVYDKGPHETRGFTIMGDKPESLTLRQKIVDSFKDDDAPLAAK